MPRRYPFAGESSKSGVLRGSSASLCRHHRGGAGASAGAQAGRRDVRDALRAALMGGVRALGASRLARRQPRRSLADVLAHHMESAGTKGYTRGELERLFGGLEDLALERVATPYDRRVAGPVAGWTGGWLGWFFVIQGRKQAIARP